MAEMQVKSPTVSVSQPSEGTKNPAGEHIGTDGKYTVQPGDTLSGLAARWGVRPEELRELNGLNNFDWNGKYGRGLTPTDDKGRDPDLILTGERLTVPQSVVRRLGVATTGEPQGPPKPTPMTDEVSGRGTPTGKTPENGGPTAASKGIEPPEKKAPTGDAKETTEGLAQKAFGMLKGLLDNPVVTGALALVPAFWPSLGVLVGAVGAIVALGTVIAGWLSGDKDGKGFDLGALGGGLLMAVGAWTGISQLVAIGGLTLFMRSMMSGGKEAKRPESEADAKKKPPVTQEQEQPLRPLLEKPAS